MMMQKTKLSDRILIVFTVFASVFMIAAAFLIGGSIEQILVFSSIIYLFSFFVTYLVSRNFSNRLTKLALEVEELAAGNLSKKLEGYGNDEIGQLAGALNELITRLETNIAIDVSKHKEIDRAKTDFVTLASHQLRTPLSIIKWYVDFMLGGDAGELDEQQKKYLKEVYFSNERLIELVNALLDVSRIDLGTFAIEPEPIDIVAKAEEAIRKYSSEIQEKNIKLEKEFDDMPPINLDPRLTKIVFENIISNSVKYTPDGGMIYIQIKKTEKDAFIKIADNGCGIPRKQQPKIFTKLFRADNVKKIESIGTGLGLYIVKAIIEKSGGKIWFESPSLELLMRKNPEGAGGGRPIGTTFFITIPLKGMKKKVGTKKLSSVT